jgi:uncharacterized membrane protein
VPTRAQFQTKNRQPLPSRRCSSNGRLVATLAVMSAIRLRGVYARHKSGKSNPMQISILWVAAAIIPIIMVLGAALGAGAMLAIFAEAVRRPRDKP